jgi:endonuclease/exonuclease/phosphatase family metal-dependent hydrolase
VLASPLLVLLPAAALWRRRSLGPPLLALLLLLVPVMGLCVPWRADGDRGNSLRVLTCNMHYGRPAPEALDRLLAETQPDVVALQEWGGRPEAHAALSSPGWHFVRDANLFLASRHPVRDHGVVPRELLGGRGAAAWYDLETPRGLVRLYSVHLASPRRGLRGVQQEGASGAAGLREGSKLRHLQAGALARAAASGAGRARTLLVGDFNTAPESVIFREELGGYTDAFARAGWGWGWTFRSRWVGVRIDHILAEPGWLIQRCWVGPDVGSPHRPVLADLEWDAPGPQ